MTTKTLLLPFSRKHYWKRIATIIFLSLFLISAIFFQFGSLLKDHLRSSTHMFLSEVNRESALVVNTKIDNCFNLLDCLARCLARHDALGDPGALEFLAEQRRISRFQRLAVTTPDGMSYTDAGVVHSSENKAYFLKSMQGERLISGVVLSPLDGENSIAFAVPIRKKKSVIGVLRGVFRASMLQEVLDVPIFGGAGYSTIINSRGEPILPHPRSGADNHTNFLETLEHSHLLDGDTLDAFRRNLQENRNGSLRYEYQGEALYLDYRKLDFNDWYILTVLPVQIADRQSNAILWMAAGLCALTALAFTILLTYWLRVEHKHKRLIEASRQELELLSDNIPGGAVARRRDAGHTLIRISTGLPELVGYSREEIQQQFQDAFLNLIYEDDRKNISAAFRHHQTEGDTLEVIYRLRHKDGGLLWVLDKAQLIQDEEYGPLYYSVIVDITDRQQAQLELEKSRQRLNNLAANIPGGVLRCRHEDSFCLDYVSDGYLELIGCSHADVQDLLQSIYPDDLSGFIMNVRQQLATGNTVHAEVRLQRKDGSLIWVFFGGKTTTDELNRNALDCVLIDITERKESLKNLYVSEERYRLLAEITDTIIYEYDILTDTIIYSSQWEHKFGHPAEIHGMLTSLCVESHMDRDSQIALQDMFVALLNGTRRASCEYRIHPVNGEPVWCLNQAMIICDENHVPIRIIGKISDINEIRKERDILTEQAQRDPLTSLYNKRTTTSLIREFLLNQGKNGKHALMVIDIDDFKRVNDTLGHLFGDAVLCGIAADLQKQFRRSDIIGRIGGDEFVIFLKNTPEITFVTKAAEALCETLQNSFTGEKKDYSVSGSVGIALYPQNGTTYGELFKNADSALYLAKQEGKNRFSLYTEAGEYGMLAEQEQSSAREGTSIPEKTVGFIGDDFSSRLFEMFYEARDINGAIAFTLQLVGKKYGVSRVSIFELQSERNVYVNTYEWCAEGIAPQKELLQSVSLEEDYTSYFDENGIFYCNDITSLKQPLRHLLERQEIRSLLQCSILDEGIFRGFVGFDECRENRNWTKAEIDSLGLIARLLGLFLIKMRTHASLKKSLFMTQSVMNTQKLWVYVIDERNYELVFFNQKTKDLLPHIQIGDYCYRTLRGRETPCENCPMAVLQATGRETTLEVHNENMHLWIEATASYVPWEDNRTAVLVCCSDITKYREQPE